MVCRAQGFIYMRALSAVTHKDYMTRRYMWKLDY